jgi:hypothetical protein
LNGLQETKQNQSWQDARKDEGVHALRLMVWAGVVEKVQKTLQFSMYQLWLGHTHGHTHRHTHGHM